MSSVWPNRTPAIGESAALARIVRARDIALFTDISGDRNPPALR